MEELGITLEIDDSNTSIVSQKSSMMPVFHLFLLLIWLKLIQKS